jgi:hypothetical protein
MLSYFPRPEKASSKIHPGNKYNRADLHLNKTRPLKPGFSLSTSSTSGGLSLKDSLPLIFNNSIAILLDDSLGQHGISHFEEPGYVGSNHQITFVAIFLGGSSGILIDVDHDLF